MTLSGEDFAFVSDLVRSLSGFVLEPGKEYLVEARLRGLARKEPGMSVPALLQRLRRDSPGGTYQTQLLESVLIGETRFFRDEHPFTAIREALLPGLLAGAASRKALRLWCAAAATGQEPYSLAMLLADFPELNNWDVRIIASDLSSLMLDRVRQGTYTEAEICRGLPAELRTRWFKEHPVGTWTVSERLRDKIRVERLNLLSEWRGLPRMDLIMIRNVLIYFDAATKREIFTRAHGLLRPGGYLLLGTSESLPADQELFTQMRHAKTIYYKRV